MAESWQDIAKHKQEEQAAKIPKEWLLSSKPSPNLNAVIDVPRRCGILTEQEVYITEQHDATALVTKLAKRELSSEEVVTAFCKRAAIAHQLTSCLTEIFFPLAISRARALDKHIKQHATPVGPLHGLPISVKDSFAIPGIDTSVGITSLAFSPAAHASTLVITLLNAGAVLYCKTNIPQTLMAMDSMNYVFGRTLNPINKNLTPGGSTGGEGALIAMRGSVLGVGTDIGGSIRVPAMCNGLYGIKPSVGRVPYGGQQNAASAASGRIGLQASAGPIATSLRDCDLFFKAVVDSQPWRIDADCIPGSWSSISSTESPSETLRIGIMRTDGVTNPLPPILRLLDEVANALRSSSTIEPIELDIVSLTKPLQSLTNNLLATDGGQHKFSLLSRTGEPTIPWVAQRMRPGEPKTLEQARAMHERREKAAEDFLSVWNGSHGSDSHPDHNVKSRGTGETESWTTQGLPDPSSSPPPKPLDAIICPVAPHPVPPIDRWNAAGYTAMWVLLDYPAGVLPVRTFHATDTKHEIDPAAPVIGSWDRENRKLWDDGMDRSVYVGSPLSVQVVVPRLQEGRLVRVMQVLENALRPLRDEGGERARL
ncbi:MAG: hypothetical protein M1821_009921 [Bathelium mastoideum]|nr:MAG: hypothetical protein M1821_009921 [Bathelium mastoideum]